jgi:hypothetical protein
VSVSEIVALLGGSGGAVALAMLSLFISGQVVPKSRVDDLKEEIAELKQERDVHAARADAGVLAAQMAKELVTGLRKELLP